METYGLRQAHQTVEGGRVVREFNTLSSGYTKSMCVEGKAGDGDVVSDNVTRDGTSAIGNGEGLIGINERAGCGGTQESVVTLVALG